jgi:molecular chaperone IbpA
LTNAVASQEDIMRAFDLSPLHRSTIGFDRLFTLLDQGAGFETPTYPPYNIERTDENAYRISLAVAGFTDTDLTIEVKENALSVRGEKAAEASEKTPVFLHQGIAARAIERRFQIADHVVVTGAKLENGLLHIDLVREVPEEKKPRQVPISAGSPAKALEAA